MIHRIETEYEYIEYWNTPSGMYYRVFNKFQGAKVFSHDYYK